MSQGCVIPPIHLYDRLRQTTHGDAWPAEWWSDPCEGTFLWTPLGGGDDWIADLHATAARTGPTGLRLQTRTTGAAVGDWLIAYRQFDYPAGMDLTMRLAVRFPTIAPIGNFQLYLTVYDGAQHNEYGLLWYPNTGVVEYVTTESALVAIPALATIPAANSWHTLAFSLDPAAVKYLAASLDVKTASLAGQGPYNNGADAVHAVLPTISLTASASPPALAHVDHIQLLRTPNP
jgi:hypothetical protein